MVAPIDSDLNKSAAAKCARCGTAFNDDDVDCPRCGEPRAGHAIEPTMVKGVEVLEGKWALEEKLGQGGMGTVYLALDLALDRKVAIKTLSAQLCSDDEVVARFEREAKMMAKLDHPNLVPIHAVGRWKKVPFIVMKFLEGTNLADHLREKGKLELPETISIIRQACAGLGFVHQRGFIHRDIKPANIFLAPDGHVTILDLGVAHDPKSSMTRSGLLIGTPKYMSPEQIMGQKIDHRSDLYAMGTVLFEMTTGKPVFDGESDFSVMRAHTDLAPPDPGEMAAEIPRAVSKVILKALAKKPEERFQSAAEMYQALDSAMRPGANTSSGYRQGTPSPTMSGSPTPPFTSPIDRVARATPTRLSESGVKAKAQTNPNPRTPARAQQPIQLTEAAPPSSPSSLDAQQAGVGKSKLPFIVAGAVAGVAIIAVVVVLATHDSGPKPIDARPIEIAQLDPKPAETKPAEAKQAETKPAEAKPAETKPAETKPAETKPAETKPAETKPAEAKPDDEKAANRKKKTGKTEVAKAVVPKETKPVETKPVETPPLASAEAKVRIAVKGAAAWAYVDLDGIRQTQSAPVTLTVTPGKHKLRVLQTGCKPIETSFEVGAGQTLKLPFELEKQ